MLTIQAVREALASVIDPELGRNLVDLNMIRDIEIEGQEIDGEEIGGEGIDGEIGGVNVRFTLALTTLACPLADGLAEQAHDAVARLPGVQHVGIHVTEMDRAEVAQLFARLRSEKPKPPRNGDKNGNGNGNRNGQPKPVRDNGAQAPIPLSFSLDPSQATLSQSLAQSLSPIRHLVGVTSGKGGVGKSLVTGLLAVALRRQGHRVGIFDVDITGASIPQLFGMNGARMKSAPEGIIPAETKTGIKIVSANFMLRDPGDPVAWRGSRIAQLITDLWRDVVWGRLDYLLFDFPPGTSDAQLTVMMELPVQGLVMVTTPQELASLIVGKAVKMSQDMRVPLLGVVENMSYFVCPETGTEHEIFGPSHAQKVANRAGVSLLGRLPIQPALAQACDAGRLEEHQMTQADQLARALHTALQQLHPAQ